MDLGLAGRTAAVAAVPAAEGVLVAVCGRDADRLASALAVIGNGAVGFVCDVSTADGGREFAATAQSMLGHVDILVANGGGPPAGTFESTPENEYLPALEKNLLSAVAMCNVVVPGMRARKWGRVLAITSLSVRQPMPNIILSNTARAGLTAYLKTMAREVAGDGVTVNTIQPGTHDTDRIRQLYGANIDAARTGVPAGTIGDADDFGAIAAFMCSEQAKFMTGTHVNVDGGAFSGLM